MDELNSVILSFAIKKVNFIFLIFFLTFLVFVLLLEVDMEILYSATNLSGEWTFKNCDLRDFFNFIVIIRCGLRDLHTLNFEFF